MEAILLAVYQTKGQPKLFKHFRSIQNLCFLIGRYRSSTPSPHNNIHNDHYRIIFGIDISSVLAEASVEHLTQEEQLFRHVLVWIINW